jgi:hypothetical protein
LFCNSLMQFLLDTSIETKLLIFNLWLINNHPDKNLNCHYGLSLEQKWRLLRYTVCVYNQKRASAQISGKARTFENLVMSNILPA